MDSLANLEVIRKQGEDRLLESKEFCLEEMEALEEEPVKVAIQIEEEMGDNLGNLVNLVVILGQEAKDKVAKFSKKLHYLD
jgi:hypothetical protein